MALHPVAGSRIYLGGPIVVPNADMTTSNFAGQSWTEIDGWELMGDIGDDPNLITTSLINRRRDVAQKGTYQVVQMENRFAVLPDDPGQIAAIAAAQSDDNYAVRVVFPNGQERMFGALIVSAREVGGEANTVRMLQVNMARNSNVVKVAAALPVNLLLPSISGIAQEDQVLTANPGSWTGAAAFTYQWQEDDGGWASISGATARTFTVPDSVVGNALRVVVTATNSQGSASANSGATADVIGA